MKAQKCSNSCIPGSVTVLLIVIALLMTLVRPAQAGGEPIVVIVNMANPVSELTIGDLKKLFLSNRNKWDTGKTVAAVMVSSGAPERRAFLKTVCGMNDGEFAKYFLQASFTGKSLTPPIEVSSAGAVKAMVATSPGAIGFIKGMGFHGDGSDGGVKAVKIDGAGAGDGTYRLRM